MKLKIVTAFVISYFILTPQGHALELEDYFPINDKNGWSYQSTGLDPVSFDKTIFTYISGQERVDYQNGHQPVGPRIYYDIELGKPDTQESYDVMRFDQNIYGGLTLMKSVDDNEYTLYGANIDPCCGPPANFSPSKPVVLAPLTFNIGDVYVVDNGLPPSSLSAGPGFVEYTYDDRGTTDRTDDLLIGERRSTMKFTFESIEPEVTVQAGTFYDVLKIKQEETASEPAFLNNPDVKATTTSYLYLAKDVGRIMEVSNEEVTTFLPGTNTVDTVTQRSRTDELINYKLSYQDVDQLVLIDWENPISARFGQKSMYDPNTGKTVWDYTLNPDIGNLPQNVVVDLDDKAEILNELRQIFRDSGMEKISIVDSHTYRLADENLPSDALSVRFGSRTTIDKTDLLGIALDIGNGVDFDDIHNERKDGEVAVFLDNDFSNKYIAELIAHEVGHGLGLRHINAFIPPEENASREVMDYQSGPGREEFTNLPAIIQEPPIDPGADPIANLPLTHNPIYHLNQYTLGQTISTWKGEVVTPGTYDTIAVEDYYSLFGLNINPNQSIYD
ncbi:MAG: hypothetical protein KC618_02530, partial [Candidatus Omnitrophica bacterium]|nr:hypothetical protein [Candidatus Omnitrophota bacterium]